MIAEKAKALDTILIVDEAYGDYMDFKDSAINLLYDFPNVMVTRTFSKAFGAAGIRMGYALFSPNLPSDAANNVKEQHRKTATMFGCNGMARITAKALLETTEDVIQVDKVMKSKRAVINTLTVFKHATTSMRTPIMTLYYDTEDPEFDLQLYLLKKEKLLTVSCGSYYALDKRFVRLMLPAESRLGELKNMLIDAQNALA
jgi:histidinol-phosphate aminotransferase